MKKLLIVFGIVVVLAVIAAFIIRANLGGIVKKALETAGPKITQTTLTIGGVSLSPSTGAGSIQDFVLGNPEGYQAPYSVKVREAKLEVETATVLSDKIHVKSIVLTDPSIIIEGGLTDNNLKKIQANVESFTGKEKANAAADTGSKKKLQIDDFLLTGATVEIRLAMLGGQGTKVPLPDIHLKNLGSEAGGIGPGELVQKILNAVFDGVFTQVKSTALSGGKGLLDAVKGASEGNKAALEKLGSRAGNLFKKK